MLAFLPPLPPILPPILPRCRFASLRIKALLLSHDSRAHIWTTLLPRAAVFSRLALPVLYGKTQDDETGYI